MTQPNSTQSKPFVSETVLQLLALAKKGASGTLLAQLSGNQPVFALKQGKITDVAFQGESTLERALSGTISSSQLRKARKYSAKHNITTGKAILQLGYIPEEETVDAVSGSVNAWFEALVTLDSNQLEFTAGEPAEAFLSDLGENYDLCLPVEELLLRAMKSFDAWQFVVEHFSCLRDVYYVTANAVDFFQGWEEPQEELAILQSIDGHKDVREVIETAGSLQFEGLEVVRALADGGYIQLVNPVQLFQLGLEAEKSENWAKALSLYQRALERGLNDFDLHFRLAHAFERLGQTGTATARYLEFAEKCLREFRFDDGLRAMKQALSLDEENIPIRRRYIKLLNKCEKRDLAAKETLCLAEMLHHKGRDGESAKLLGEIRGTCPENPAFQERLISLAESCGAHGVAREAREGLGRLYTGRESTHKALEYFQKLFVQGEDTLNVRLKLSELHILAGNREKALEHLSALLAFGNPYGIRDLDKLRRLHQQRCELTPPETDSYWFLIEDALGQKDVQTAEKHLRELLARLSSDKERNERIMALKRLISILPQNQEYRWQLAKEYENSGEKEKAASVLKKLVSLNKETKKFTEGVRALREVLRICPFEVPAREELAALLAETGHHEAAGRERRNIALLRLVEGNIEKGRSLCREIADKGGNDAYLLFLLADSCSQTGDTQRAAEQYGQAGKLLASERNFGLATRCMEAVRNLGTNSALVEELKKRIENAPAGTELLRDQTNKQREPFSPMQKQVLYKSVSPITSKLKSLKPGGNCNPRATGKAQPHDQKPAEKTRGSAAEPKATLKGLSSAVDKLKAVGGKDTGSAGRKPRQASSASTGGESSSVNPASSSQSSETRPAAPGKGNGKPAVLKGAAEKLRALKCSRPPSAGSGSQPEAEAPASGSTSTSGGQAPKEKGPAAVEQEKTEGSPKEKQRENPSQTQKKQKLGGAAAKLAQLRKQ